jgi:hypothetical protein
MEYTEEEYIEKVATLITDNDLEPFAAFFLQALKPVAFVSGELAFFFYAPLLPLLDNMGYDFLDTFQKRENIDSLIKKVDELAKEKEKIRKSKRKPDFFDNLYRKIKKLIK